MCKPSALLTTSWKKKPTLQIISAIIPAKHYWYIIIGTEKDQKAK